MVIIKKNQKIFCLNKKEFNKFFLYKRKSGKKIEDGYTEINGESRYKFVNTT